MAKRRQRVLVLYGGDGATAPRNELVAWMVEKKALNAEPALVAWGVAHSELTVSERVKREIEQADKAIAIVTKDERSEYGAPNILEEIGRWLQARGGWSLCVIRQEGTKVNSNAAGLVYLSFDSRIREVFDDLRDFLADDGVAAPPAAAPVVAPVRAANGSAEMTIAANPGWVLIAQRPYRKVRVEEAADCVTATVVCADSADELALRGLSRRGELELVYGNHVAQGKLVEAKISHEAETTATVVLSPQEAHAQRASGYEMSFGGPNGMSADEIAEARARRLLTGEPRARKNDMHGPEMMIRGMGSAIQVTESPIPGLLAGQPREERGTWERVRLELVRLLVLTNCVESVDMLSLQVVDGKLVHVDFRGTRPRYGSEAVLIEVGQAVKF